LRGELVNLLLRNKYRFNRRRLGKLLQDILDLLKTANSDTERKILDDWKHRASRMQSKACFNYAEAQPMLRYAKALLSQYTVVYDVAHTTGMADMEHMFLTLKGRSLMEIESVLQRTCYKDKYDIFKFLSCT